MIVQALPSDKILHRKTLCLNRFICGIKNDAQREGFEVILPKSNVVKIDPEQTLYDSAIVLAGLSTQEFFSKSFSPT